MWLRPSPQQQAAATLISCLRLPKGLMELLTSSAAADAGSPPELAATVGIVELAGGVAGAGSPVAGCVTSNAEFGAALAGPREGPIKAVEVTGRGTGTVFTGAGPEAGTAGAAGPAGAAVDCGAAPAVLAGGAAPEVGGAAAAAAVP